MKYMKVTKSNWKGIVNKIKKKNHKVYTVRGSLTPASKANFYLRKISTGKYTIIAKKKK